MESPEANSPASPEPTPRPIEVEVRRSPKFWPFIGTGALVGVVAALVSAYTGPPSQEFTPAAVAGFLAVFFGMFGVLFGGIAYLIVDRVLLKRGKRTTAVPVAESPAS